MQIVANEATRDQKVTMKSNVNQSIGLLLARFNEAEEAS